MTTTTVLGLSRAGFSLSDYAARGLSMTLEPIDSAKSLRRDINGNLIDLSEPQMRKYKAHISCTDQESPGFAEMTSAADPIWPGDEFTVTCLPQLGAAEAITLTMLVTAWQINRDEYNADTGWTLDLEEA